jgi:hypothetical protein
VVRTSANQVHGELAVGGTERVEEGAQHGNCSGLTGSHKVPQRPRCVRHNDSALCAQQRDH